MGTYAVLNGVVRMTLNDLAKFSTIPSVARPFCDSRASLYSNSVILRLWHLP